MGSENPTDIIVPIWIASLFASIIGIVAAKMLQAVSRNKLR
jgi:spore maturation protein SpmA